MKKDFDFDKNYQMLNDAQKQVVDSFYGPIMVLAGPGTGKTQIIGMRTAQLIKEGVANPENILITTFTEAGVAALKKRLSDFIGTEAYKVHISTIHSFAQDVISYFPEKFSDCKASETIDDIESLQVLTQIIDTYISNNSLEYLYNAYDRYMYLRDIKDRIGKLKGEGISPDMFMKIIAEQRSIYDQKLEELSENKRIRDLEKRRAKDSENYKKQIGKLTELHMIYEEYSKYLRENRLYDFADMINFVVEKMKTDEDIVTYYAEKYQFLMIDEYQDTNNPQNEIMNMILSIGDEKNIMVVGDDDQSIYRFQGANIENMLDFYSHYPDTNFIVLENNYRSAQSILDLSTKLIRNNSERLVNRLDFLDKSLLAQADHKGSDNNSYHICPDELSEKIFVNEEIKKDLKNDNNCSIAIITRSNREVAEWTEYLQSLGHEVESKLKTDILANKYVQFLIDFLIVLNNPHKHDDLLIDIMRSDISDLENIDVITLNRDLYKKNYSREGFRLSFWEVFSTIDVDYAEQYKGEEKNYSFATRQESKFRDYQKLLDFRELILGIHKEQNSHNIGTLISIILEKVGLLEYVESNASFSDLEDIYSFFRKVEEIQSRKSNISLEELLEKFELHKKYNLIIPKQVMKQGNAQIEILTAHGSKGLEYDFVYIPGLYSGNWESKRMIDKLKLPLGISGDGLQFSDLDEKDAKSIEKETQSQEDRRLFFVALTRAKKKLTLSRPAGKNNKPYIDSPFVLEIGMDTHVQETQVTEENQAASMKSILLGEGLVNISDDELDYISDFLENYKLSPTDLNTFLEDPHMFLRNVVFKYPFDGNEFTIFGNVYHKVLEEFTNQKQNGIDISLGMMTERFLQLLGKQVLTAEEQKRLEKKGIEGLTGYFEHFSSNQRQVLDVEYNFRPRNIVFEDIPITGKIDKIEKVEDVLGGAETQGQIGLFSSSVALVDYKTGSTKTLGTIKGEDRYGNKKEDMSQGKYYRQLLFYKLLAENDPEFTKEYQIGELALDFVEGKNGDYKYVPVEYSEEDFEVFRKLVKDSWKKINDLKFWKEVLGK